MDHDTDADSLRTSKVAKGPPEAPTLGMETPVIFQVGNVGAVVVYWSTLQPRDVATRWRLEAMTGPVIVGYVPLEVVSVQPCQGNLPPLVLWGAKASRATEVAFYPTCILTGGPNAHS